jgi:hypothetical protein
MYHKVPLTLTESQFKKMKAGHPIQLAHHQIGGGGLKHHLMLHPETAKKVAGAVRRGKGVRIHVSPHEFQASGEGIMDFFNKLKDAGKWVKEKVIDTPFYQQNIRPIARQLVNTGLDMAATKLGPAADIARKGAYALGDTTGAFGLKAPKKRGRKAICQTEYALDSNYSPMVGPMHPAMWPTVPNLPDIGGAVRKQPRAPAAPVHHRKGRGNRGFGGSFRPA